MQRAPFRFPLSPNWRRARVCWIDRQPGPALKAWLPLQFLARFPGRCSNGTPEDRPCARKFFIAFDFTINID